MQWFNDTLAHLTDKQHACASGYLDTYKHGQKKIVKYGFEIIVSEMFNRCSFITSVDKYQYDKYATSRQFLLAVTKTISTVANVSVIRVNGIRVSELDCVAYY